MRKMEKPLYNTAIPTAYSDAYSYQEAINTLFGQVKLVAKTCNQLIDYINAEGLPDNLQIIVDKQIVPITERMDDIDATIFAMGEEFRGLIDSNAENINELRANFLAAVESLTLDINILKDDLTQINDEFTQFKADYAQFIIQLFTRFGNNEVDIEDLQAATARLETEIADLDTQLEAFKTNQGFLNTSYSTKLVQLDNRVVVLEGKVNEPNFIKLRLSNNYYRINYSGDDGEDTPNPIVPFNVVHNSAGGKFQLIPNAEDPFLIGRVSWQGYPSIIGVGVTVKFASGYIGQGDATSTCTIRVCHQIPGNPVRIIRQITVNSPFSGNTAEADKAPWQTYFSCIVPVQGDEDVFIELWDGDAQTYSGFVSILGGLDGTGVEMWPIYLGEAEGQVPWTPADEV